MTLTPLWCDRQGHKDQSARWSRPAEAVLGCGSSPPRCFQTVWGWGMFLPLSSAGSSWGFELWFMGTTTLLLLFLEFWVQLRGWRGSAPPDRGVRGPEWSKAGVGAIFHSDKINSSLKGAKSRQRSSFCSKAYPGPQRSKETFLKSDRPSF